MPRTIETTVYTFDELSEEAKECAINYNRMINHHHEWWDCTYDDARNIGLKITSFDTGYRESITGDLLEQPHIVAKTILQEHGEQSETYACAEAYNAQRNLIVNRQCDTNEALEEQDQQLIDLSEQFLKDLLECYLTMLRNHSDYLESDEAIAESLISNAYDFLITGKRVF